MVELKTESHCPIIKLIMGTHTTIQDTKIYLRELSNRVQKEEFFGIVIELPHGQPSQERGCQKLEKDWLSFYKSALNKYCFGVAMVTDSWVVQNIWSPILKQFYRRFLGVDCYFFACRSDAQIWLMDKYLGNQQSK
jgi:hypothetical protein